MGHSELTSRSRSTADGLSVRLLGAYCKALGNLKQPPAAVAILRQVPAESLATGEEIPSTYDTTIFHN